jgi:glutathione S-transferase
MTTAPMTLYTWWRSQASFRVRIALNLFCRGDAPTIADICLVPHLTSAKMLYDCDLEPYPTVRRIFEACMQIDAFALAHPLQQLDAPRTI